MVSQIVHADPDACVPIPWEMLAGWESLSQISPGSVTACAVLSIEKDAGVCWGRQLDNNNRLANFSEPTYSTFNPAGDRNWQAMSTGSYTNSSTGVEDSFTCGLDQDDRVWCWGSDFSGVGLLGAGRPQSSSVPLALADGGPWERVAVGDGSACAIKYVDNSLWCWGSNLNSRLGEIVADGSWSPVVAFLAQRRCFSLSTSISCLL